MGIKTQKSFDIESLTTRFDVVYGKDGATIEPHFCREWDDEGGCYGMNSSHGMSATEACDEVADWHERRAKMWRNRTHHDIVSYVSSQENEGDIPNDF